MNEKKVFWIVAAIAVVLVGALVYFQKPAQAPINVNQEPLIKTFDPNNPGFVMGVVTNTTETQIEFSSGPGVFTAKIDSNTQLVKQITENKSVKTVPATVSDFKANTRIVVYFSAPLENNIYKAEKIQIISQ